MEYERICDRVAKNGEPGFAWLDNMQRYGRMEDPAVGSYRFACSLFSHISVSTRMTWITGLWVGIRVWSRRSNHVRKSVLEV